MRIYPPGWITGREALDDDEIAGVPIPGGSQVYVSPFIVHRHPGFWENPNQFDPERFNEGQSKGRHKFAFFPFGGGPRYCIGNNFAMMEMQVILATLLRHFKISPLSSLPPAMNPMLTLKPLEPVLLRPEPRFS
jgi:cytochrome P450